MKNIRRRRMKKRRSDWGKGWDGRSRIPDNTYRENFNKIDWSSVKNKKDKKAMDVIIDEAIKYDIKK
jgi:hypothetical protein